MTVAELIQRVRDSRAAKLVERNTHAAALATLRNQAAPDVAAVVEHQRAKAALDAELDAFDARIAELETEQARDESVARASQEQHDSPHAGGEALQPVAGRAGAGARAAGQKFTVRGSQDPAAVVAGQRFADHPAVARAAAAPGALAQEQATVAMHGNFAGLVRSLTTSGASAVVPVSWASELVDLARANAAVMQAGATLISMPTQTVQIGRITADPTTAFRTEGSAITASDPAFDNVTLVAKSASCMVQVTSEWLQDATDGEQMVTQVMGRSMGLAIDKAALYGGITSGAGSINLPTPPNPRGVLAALQAVRPTSVLGGSATNGTPLTFYDQIIDLDYLVENLNENPTGLIWPSRLAQAYAKLKDTTNQPIRRPGDLDDLPFYVSNQVQSGMTQGTLTTAADAFLGDWSELLIGQRLEMTLQRLDERYADSGMVAFVLSWRGDIQPARTSAFAVYRYLAGA